MKDWLYPTVLALLSWVGWAFLPKLAARYIDAQSAMVYQSIGGILVGVGVLLYLNFQVAYNPPGFIYSLAIGLLGFFGAFMYMLAASRGPLALVAPLTAMYPVGAILLGFLVLGESVTTKQGVGIGMSLIAIYLISS